MSAAARAPLLGRGSSPTTRDARTRWILRGGRQTPQSGRSQRTDEPRARHSCSRSRAANRTTRRVRPRRSLPLRLDDLGRYPATSRSELHLLAAHLLPTRRRRAIAVPLSRSASWTQRLGSPSMLSPRRVPRPGARRTFQHPSAASSRRRPRRCGSSSPSKRAMRTYIVNLLSVGYAH